MTSSQGRLLCTHLPLFIIQSRGISTSRGRSTDPPTAGEGFRCTIKTGLVSITNIHYLTFVPDCLILISSPVEPTSVVFICAILLCRLRGCRGYGLSFKDLTGLNCTFVVNSHQRDPQQLFNAHVSFT